MGDTTALAGRDHDPGQPYRYPPTRDFVEPDWRRLPGYRDVTEAEWTSARWQRLHTIKNLDELRRAFGPLLPEDLAESIARDQQERATMSMLVPPQMINTMDEADMWAVEGLTHRYPTKVLAELLATCPQYCGHCTRMDLVGNDTLQVLKYKFEMKQNERWDAMLDYLRRTPSVRDVVVSGGDMANLPAAHLEEFVSALLDIPHIRDVRLATKGLMGLPQHFLQDEVLASLERLAKKAIEREVDLAVHTHVNHARSLTPLVAKATRKLLDMGFRDVRNQGVLLRGVNATPEDLLDLCFTLMDHAKVMPYYFYMCDMIPNSEHWRVSVADAQELQHAIMGYMPGFATPRIVCDVPFVGKRWVHQVEEYDRVRGISYWTKNYRTGIEHDDPDALTRRYEYYDPIDTLPVAGQAYWRDRASQPASA